MLHFRSSSLRLRQHRSLGEFCSLESAFESSAQRTDLTIEAGQAEGQERGRVPKGTEGAAHRPGAQPIEDLALNGDCNFSPGVGEIGWVRR